MTVEKCQTPTRPGSGDGPAPQGDGPVPPPEWSDIQEGLEALTSSDVTDIDHQIQLATALHGVLRTRLAASEKV